MGIEEFEKNARDNFNRCGFITQTLIPIMDSLQNTTAYRQQFRNRANGFIKELEKVDNIHFSAYNTYGKLKQDDQSKVDAKDIYNITSKAYDFLLTKKPNEIVVIANMISELEKKSGIDYDNFSIGFEPVKQ